MAQVSKTAATGGGIKPCVGHVLQGGDTGGPAVWIIVLGTGGRDDKGGRENPCGVSTPDHREAGEATKRWVMGNTGGLRITTDSGYAVGVHLHRTLEGNGSKVGDRMTNLGVMHTGNLILGARN